MKMIEKQPTRKVTHSPARLSVVIAAGLLLTSISGRAGTLYWDADNTNTPLDYGNGTISTAALNWWNATSYVGWSNSTSDTMQIGSNSAQGGKSYTSGSTAPPFTMTLGQAISLGQIVLSSNYSSGNTVTISDGGTVANTLTFGGALQISNQTTAGTLAIDAQIATASGTLVDNSSGTVIFTRNNSYAQPTTIQGSGNTAAGGTLQIGNGGTSGSLGAGVIQFILATSQTTASTLNYNRSDAVTVVNAINSFNANTVGGTIQQSGSNTLKFTGATAIGNASATLTYNIGSNAQAINTEVSGVISGAGNIAKSGAGTLLFSNANTYTGNTTINGGTLLVNNTSGSGIGTGNVVVGNGTGLNGTLGGTGKINFGAIANMVMVNANSNISPGMNTNTLNPGVLTITGTQNTTAVVGSSTLNLASGSNYVLEIGSSAAAPVAGTDYDQINLIGTASIAGSNLNISLVAGYNAPIGTQYTILNNDAADAVLGTFAQGAVASASGMQFTINYAGGDGNDIVLTLAAVPEPSTYAMFAVGFAMLLGVQRWRKRV